MLEENLHIGSMYLPVYPHFPRLGKGRHTLAWSTSMVHRQSLDSASATGPTQDNNIIIET